MVLPAVIVILLLRDLPADHLGLSGALALRAGAGGFTLKLRRPPQLQEAALGSQQYHLLGTFGHARRRCDWAVLAAGRAALLVWLCPLRPQRPRPAARLVGRLDHRRPCSSALALLSRARPSSPAACRARWSTRSSTSSSASRVQFLLGLGLALLCAQPIRGRNFFRVALLRAADGDAGRHRLHLPHARRHAEGPVRAALRALRHRRMVLGDRGLVGAADGADRRHLAVDAVHVHRAARRDREPAARPGRGGAARRRQRLADLPRHHLAGDRAGRRHRRADPPDRGLQDRRPAQRADRRRPRASPPNR